MAGFVIHLTFMQVIRAHPITIKPYLKIISFKLIYQNWGFCEFEFDSIILCVNVLILSNFRAMKC